MLRIAIIGTGRMASGLAAGWARAGHQVVLGSRTPDQRDAPEAVRVIDVAEALQGAEVVVLAIPYQHVENFAREHAETLRAKLVIDISNPFDHLPDNRVAGAEVTAAAIGAGARVVAAFKDNFWTTLAEPRDPSGIARDVHIAGDSEADCQEVGRLAADLGFQPVVCGPLRQARHLDSLVALLVDMDRRAGGRMRSSWKFL